jgi:hypothetical protein
VEILVNGTNPLGTGVKTPFINLKSTRGGSDVLTFLSETIDGVTGVKFDFAAKGTTTSAGADCYVIQWDASADKVVYGQEKQTNW